MQSIRAISRPTVLSCLHSRTHAMSRRIITYAIHQSTDEDAFDPLPPSATVSKSNQTAHKTDNQSQSESAPGMSVKETRKAALADVVRQSQSKEGTGKMKGKVGIITGVGPLTGIGVSSPCCVMPRGRHLADSRRRLLG